MVLESVILGILAAIGWGISDLIVSMVSRKLGVLRSVLGVHLSTIAVTTLYLLLGDDLGRLSANQWGLFAGIGLLSLFVYFSFYRALQIGPIAIISPIASSYAVVVMLLAVLVAGENLSRLQTAGVAASIGGVILASLDFRSIRRRRKLVTTGVMIGIIATICMGVWQYSLGVMSRDLGWFLPIYVSRLMTLIYVIPLSIYWKAWDFKRFGMMALLLVAAAGILETLGLFAFTRGTEIGVISIVAAASTIYPVLPILGGLLVLRERLAYSQVAGLVIVMTGLVVLSLSS